MMMTKMKKMSMKTNKIFIAVLFFSFAFAVTLPARLNASELTDTADKDWLELVREYSSDDTIIKTKTDDYSSKWDRLVKGLSQKDDFLSEWWRIFDDDVLTDLIESAFLSNRDLMASRAKVLEARAVLGMSRTNFGVKPDFNAGYENGRNSDVEDEEEKSYNKYSLGFDASWEIDFWGRNENKKKAAKANLEAEYADLENARVSLSAEIAMNYINLLTLQRKLEIAENNLETQSELLDILKSRLESGLADELSVKQAQSEIETARAQIPEINKSLNQTMNALAILTGSIPGSLNEKLSVKKKFPEIEISKFVGIPAETLRQRPDIRAAERKLTAQIQTRKAAEKNLYPAIQLLGSIGLETFSTGHIFSSGSYTYSIGPSVSIPIFNAGEIRRNIQAQSAVEEQLSAEFENVILKAVAEVHDAINANVQEILRNKSLDNAMKAAVENYEITKNKYSNGLINFAEVLKARQNVFSVESEIISSEGQKFINLIALFKSLGGGWKNYDE